MTIENERKLVLDKSRAPELLTTIRQMGKSGDLELFDITQGYLSGSARIRHVVPHKKSSQEKFIFTYKTKVSGSTVEIETDITSHDYQKLSLVVKPVILKTRAKLQDGVNTWDIDFFKTPKSGNIYLAMAEVEMPEFENELPSIIELLEPYALRWVDLGDKRFNNRNLANPKKVAQSLTQLAAGEPDSAPKTRNSSK